MRHPGQRWRTSRPDTETARKTAAVRHRLLLSYKKISNKITSGSLPIQLLSLILRRNKVLQGKKDMPRVHAPSG